MVYAARIASGLLIGAGLWFSCTCVSAHTARGVTLQTRCTSLMRNTLDHSKVESAVFSPAGFYPSPTTVSAGVLGFILPASCRVSIVLTPTSDSHIESEVWLPAENWNGRLQGVDNGGMGGSINIRGLMLALKYGYATTSTDTGHEAPDTDTDWAVGHPEKVADLSWRAIHETAIAAKHLITDFYGKPAKHAYFSGGSNGGREALLEAERFPADYDGIVAGAPSLDAANNLTTEAWFQYRLLQNIAGAIPDTKAAMITAAVMRACDAQDGVVDGVLEDPTTCHFDPATLTCPGADAPDCLTAPQVAWLKDLYNGPGGTYKGIRNWGLARGGEAGWVPFWFSAAPGGNMGAVFSISFFRNIVYNDPTWNFDRFSFAKDRVAAAEGPYGPEVEANSADLESFKARGGKLILYQGWSDPFVPPGIIIDYYKRIQKEMGLASTADFVRLYMVPGMGHVTGGPGPNVFGQITPGAASNPRHSVNAAIEQWVEKGIAPGAIIAGKYKNDRAALLTPGSARPLSERPLCPYPQHARWIGHGSTNHAENFRCVDIP